MTKEVQGGQPKSLFVDEAKFGKAVHASLKCKDCHADLKDDHSGGTNPPGKVHCGTCHASEDKIYHQVLQLTFWSPTDPQKKRCSLYIIDLASPVQSQDAVFSSQNQFLGQSLVGISLYLKEFYKDKQAAAAMCEYDSNYLTKILKKVLSNYEGVAIFPLVFVNSQEDYKEESKQLL